MLKKLYTKILQRLNLTNEQLVELIKHLNPEEISAARFIDGSKMCPNTKALDIKLNRTLVKNKQFIIAEFKKIGVTNIDLSLWFLILYDIPSMGLLPNVILVKNS